MAKNDVQVNFRMPSELKAALEEQARLTGRSLTAEIVARLQFGLDFDGAVSANGPDFVKHVTQKLDAQEQLLRENREELALIKAWLRAGKPDMRDVPAELQRELDQTPED